ncbi:MAG: hypothetical protein QM528_05390 [Phycisphaerales bacterium]|nr:hypothetical protein [Phycisphaerales bacterium]
MYPLKVHKTIVHRNCIKFGNNISTILFGQSCLLLFLLLVSSCKKSFNPYNNVPFKYPDYSKDSAILVNFYDSTNGIYWVNNTGWLKTNLYNVQQDATNWIGLGFSDALITSLSFAGNGIYGQLPNNLGNFQGLTTIDIQGYTPKDSLAKINPSLGNIKGLLNLRLSGMQIRDTIPYSILNLSNLLFLSFKSNQLYGTIPSQIGELSKLTGLILTDNQLTGTIPNSLYALSKLNNLSLNSNQLSGSISNNLSNLVNLVNLNLGNNNFSGDFTNTLNKLTALQFLNLSNNSFSGPIPSSITSCVSLQAGSISSNYSSLRNAGFDTLATDPTVLAWLRARNIQYGQGN